MENAFTRRGIRGRGWPGIFDENKLHNDKRPSWKQSILIRGLTEAALRHRQAQGAAVVLYY